MPARLSSASLAACAVSRKSEPTVGSLSVAAALDGGVEQTLVGGELLRPARPRARAQDGDEVVRLHLLVHELPQAGAHGRDALEREAEVIYDERDGAPHLPALKRGGGRRRADRRRRG